MAEGNGDVLSEILRQQKELKTLIIERMDGFEDRMDNVEDGLSGINSELTKLKREVKSLKNKLNQ